MRLLCACDANFTSLAHGGGVVLRSGERPRQALDAVSKQLGLRLVWDRAPAAHYSEWLRPQPLQAWPGLLPHQQRGYDPVCNAEDLFESASAWFRDLFKSRSCQTQPRERALKWVLDTALPRWREATVHESSPNAFGVSRHLKEALDQRYTASQFHPTLKCGTPLNTSMGEVALDLERQCFANSTFDLVVTQDVFEHVFNPRRALREIARTLKPGGVHLFTVPVTSKRNPTFRAASHRRDKNGEMFVELHAPPEVHGNPMGAGGALLTHQYGYDLLNDIHAWTGMSTRAVYVESRHLGIVHVEYREVYLSHKPGPHQLFANVRESFGVDGCWDNGVGFVTCVES